MKRLKRTLIFILVLALAFGTVSASAASATATTLRLAGYSGSVTVKNASGNSQSVKTDMRLYSGYSVSTGKSSAAYISLDGSKAVKLDSSSKVTVKKSGNKLEVCLDSGKLFFNVTAPLASNESLNIRTSTMVTGIRGSYGWVSEYEVGLLHGHVTLTCINPVTSETRVTELYSGDRVYYDPSSTVSADPNLKEIDFIKEKITNKDIPAFVVEELRKDVSLQDPIIRDVPTVDVPKLLGDYDSIKAAEEERIAVLEQKISEALEKQQEVISQSQADYLFTDDSGSGGGYTTTSYSVTLPDVHGMIITTSDPTSGIAAGTDFTFQIKPDTDYALYEEYLQVSAGSAEVTLEDDSDGGFFATFTVNRNTNVSASGAVYQATNFNDALVALSTGDQYAELISSDTSIPGETIYSGKTLIIGPDAELQIGDALTNEGRIVVNGTLSETGGDLTNNGTIDINTDGSLLISGGYAYNYGTITNKGSLSVEELGTFYNYSNNTLVNEGSLMIDGLFNNGDGTQGNAGRVVNHNDTEFAVLSGGVFNNNRYSEFVNEGSLDVASDGLFNNLSSKGLTNKYVLSVSGDFYNGDGDSQPARLVNEPGESSASITIEGLFVNKSNGTLVNEEGAIFSLDSFSSGAMENYGAFTNNGEFTGENTFDNHGTVTNNGRFEETGYMHNNGSMINNNGAEMIVRSGTNGSAEGGPYGAGTITNRTGGTMAIAYGTTFRNCGDGTIVNGGAFELRGESESSPATLLNVGTIENTGTIAAPDGYFGKVESTTSISGCENVEAVTITAHTLTFNANGGVMEISSLVVPQAYAVASYALPEPTKDGYEFEGWYKDSELTQAWAGGSGEFVDEDMTVYAKWVETP